MDKGFQIIRLSASADLGQLAGLHQEAFSRSLIGQLGEPFLHRYYMKIWQNPRGVIFLCRENESLAGFIAGWMPGRKIMDGQLYGRACLGMFCNIAAWPRVFVNLMRYLQREILAEPLTDSAEILSIAVRQGYGRRGIGEKLLLAFESDLKSRGIAGCHAWTTQEYPCGCQFYEKYGFSVQQEIKSLGVAARRYKKQF